MMLLMMMMLVMTMLMFCFVWLVYAKNRRPTNRLHEKSKTAESVGNVFLFFCFSWWWDEALLQCINYDTDATRFAWWTSSSTSSRWWWLWWWWWWWWWWWCSSSKNELEKCLLYQILQDKHIFRISIPVQPFLSIPAQRISWDSLVLEWRI